MTNVAKGETKTKERRAKPRKERAKLKKNRATPEEKLVKPKKQRATPTILYTWAGAIVALLVVSAALSFLAVQTMSSAGERIAESTGPVLITTQGLVSSIAEADAANTAVFLSGIDGGNEDVEQRRLYESAVARAPAQIEDISAGIGDDTATHDALKLIAQQLVQYAGVVEQARVSNINDIDGANELLADSLDLTGGTEGILANANVVTARTEAQFDDDSSAGFLLLVGAIAVLVVTLIVLVMGQMNLRKLTNRLINFGLVAASISVVALIAWLAIATFGRSADLGTAENEGFADISLSAELQTAAFNYKTQETNAIIREDTGGLPEPALLDDIDRQLGRLTDNADTARERAQVEALVERWNRYLLSSGVIAQRVRSSNFDEARNVVGGEGNQNFNGFNTTAEALVLTNEDQFNAAVTNATSRLDWLNFATILLPALAALLAWLGYRPRINEYF